MVYFMFAVIITFLFINSSKKTLIQHTCLFNSISMPNDYNEFMSLTVVSFLLETYSISGKLLLLMVADAMLVFVQIALCFVVWISVLVVCYVNFDAV